MVLLKIRTQLKDLDSCLKDTNERLTLSRTASDYYEGMVKVLESLDTTLVFMKYG